MTSAHLNSVEKWKSLGGNPKILDLSVSQRACQEVLREDFDVLHKTGSILYLLDYAREHIHQY